MPKKKKKRAESKKNISTQQQDVEKANASLQKSLSACSTRMHLTRFLLDKI